MGKESAVICVSLLFFMASEASLTDQWWFHFRNQGQCMHLQPHLTVGGDIAERIKWPGSDATERISEDIHSSNYSPLVSHQDPSVDTCGDRAFPAQSRWPSPGRSRSPRFQPPGWWLTLHSYEHMSSRWPWASQGQSLWLFLASYQNKSGWKQEGFRIKPKRLSMYIWTLGRGTLNHTLTGGGGHGGDIWAALMVHLWAPRTQKQGTKKERFIFPN